MITTKRGAFFAAPSLFPGSGRGEGKGVGPVVPSSIGLVVSGFSPKPYHKKGTFAMLALILP